MGRISNTYANQMLNILFGKATNSFPDTLYVGLSSTTPADGGTNVTEPSGGSYARVAVTNNSTNWPTATSRSKSNGLPITFGAATADWLSGASLTHFVVYDALTSGTMVAWGALTTSITVTAGTQPSFTTGSLVISAPGT
jgi:hypothetical protein